MISLLRQDNSLSANTLANSLGITQRQAQRILSKLKDEGKLLRHGANKNGYKLVPQDPNDEPASELINLPRHLMPLMKRLLQQLRRHIPTVL